MASNEKPSRTIQLEKSLRMKFLNGLSKLQDSTTLGRETGSLERFSEESTHSTGLQENSYRRSTTRG